jgi:SNF2 family DNA or RNA helicase
MIQLYPHQEDAVAWMVRSENRPRMVPDQPHGGILAHAMGLGKTISMLTLILRQNTGNTLVVCPKSLLLQWYREARLVGFPDSRVVIYHGGGRYLGDLSRGHTVVLTTFDIVRIEFCHAHRLHDTRWGRVVLDEAHRVCEQSSKTSRAIQSLRARNRWCVTGTPFKNGMSDLIALSRFIMVAPYCNASWWRMFGHNSSKLKEWRDRFIHMRDKTELTELPPVEYHNIKVTLPPKERGLYVSLDKLEWKQETGEDDPHELLKILRQRQATNHPLLVAASHDTTHVMKQGGGCVGCGGDGTTTCTESHVLCEQCRQEPLCVGCIVRELRVVGEAWVHSAKTRALWAYLRDQARVTHTNNKVVIFSQWTSCLDLLGCMLHHEGVGFECYDGRVNSTEEREDVIRRFRDGHACKVLLTSLGAGGEGVNLTFATHVVLMEPYWNLAVEQQAVDRLHRIGQTQTTHVVRFITDDTIEDWVQEIQAKKTTELRRVLFGVDTKGVPKVVSCIREQYDDIGVTRSSGLTSFIRAKRIKR